MSSAGRRDIRRWIRPSQRRALGGAEPRARRPRPPQRLRAGRARGRLRGRHARGGAPPSAAAADVAGLRVVAGRAGLTSVSRKCPSSTRNSAESVRPA